MGGPAAGRGGTGPDRLTRSDAAVVAVFIVAAVLAFVLLPAPGDLLLRALAAAGIALLMAVLAGLIAYRAMRRGDEGG